MGKTGRCEEIFRLIPDDVEITGDPLQQLEDWAGPLLRQLDARAQRDLARSIAQTLRQSHAWVSLAHPMHYELTRSKRRRLIADYIQAGGQALEVVNGMMPAEQVGTMSILAREFGLLASAGSDFHGPGAWSEIGVYRPLPEDLPPLWRRFKHEQPTAPV